jgi:hypothetical protein
MANVRHAVLSALSATALIVAGSPAPAVAAGPRLGTLLPIPAGATSVTAADVTPRGVVGGTATTATGDLPLRWTARGRTLQELTLPAGATAGSVTGLTDRGEAAGAVTLDGVSRAARWSADGRTVTTIGGAGSQVTATGPAGPWAVFTAGTDPIGTTGESDLVTRSGARTPLRGTPELDSGYRRSVVSITDEHTALVWVVNGVGRGTTAHPVLWQDGATVTLPVLNYAGLGRACASRPLPDGSVVLSGYTNASGSPKFVLVRHLGGVPGTDIVLSEASPSASRYAGLSCGELTPDVLASDGGFAGYVGDAQGRRAAFWDASDVVTEIPLGPGEGAAAVVATASGGRMVIQAEGTDGVQRLSLWHNGVRTPLRNPPGWSVSAVVELTEDGVLVANLRDRAGTVRPAIWRLN